MYQSFLSELIISSLKTDFCGTEFKNSFYKSRIHLGFGYSITLLLVGSLEKGHSAQMLSSSPHQELPLE